MPPRLSPPPLAILLAVCASACASARASARAPARAPAAAPPPGAPAPGRPLAYAAELLRHHPGVKLVETRGGMRLFVRGALDEPLVILDGVALPPDPRGVLSIVQPRDVAAIRVLTGPAELTYYGARGANGVVIVATRRR